MRTKCKTILICFLLSQEISEKTWERVIKMAMGLVEAVMGVALMNYVTKLVVFTNYSSYSIHSSQGTVSRRCMDPF